MNITLEIVKFIVPSLIVFATAYLLIREFLKREEKKMKQELFLSNQKEITPIRLQAYERLLIFLERIHPESLIIRENQAGLNNQQLQQKLIQVIRTEFEHNIAQQIYISSQVWAKVKNAKENVIKTINMAASQLPPSDSSINLSKSVIETFLEQQNSPLQDAIESLKQEVAEIWQ